MNQPDNKSKILSAMAQCGAFEPSQLDQAEDLARQARDANTFARLLLSNQILTQWQLQRLASGRRKLTLGKYVLLKQLDGRVVPTYLAVHPGMERQVEIRLIGDEILDLARAYADSDHPGLIHVFDLDTDDQLQFLVTETVNGLPFEPFWAKHSDQDLGVFVQQFRQAVEAIRGLHDCGLSCAGIKANQFWIDASQTLKMGVDDFRKIRECTPEFASDDLRAIVQLFRERSHALGMDSVCQMLEPLEQVKPLSYGEVLANIKRFQAARTTHEVYDDQADVAHSRVPYSILLAGIALVAIVCGLGIAAIGMQLRSNQQAARVETTEKPGNDWWKRKTSSAKDSVTAVDKANTPLPDAKDVNSIKESEPNTIVSSGLGAALQETGKDESGAKLEMKTETAPESKPPGSAAETMPNAASDTNKQTTESSVAASVREEDKTSMVLQNPFASWPAAFDLPQSGTDNQVALADFATTNGHPIDWSELTITLLGAETAHRGSVSFQVTAATDLQGDLPEWLLQMKMQGDAQPIAKLHIAENRLMFSWAPQEARSNLCNHLRNCVLRIGYESFSAEVALRSVVVDDRPIWVSCLAPTIVPKVAIEWPPSAEATFLAVTVGDQAFAGMRAGDATSIDKPSTVQVLVKNVPQIEYEVQLDQKKDRITVNGFLLQPDGVNAIALNVESIQAANLQRVALRNQADLLRRNKSKLRDIPNPRRKILETEVEAQIRLAKSMDDQIEKTLELCDKIESSGAGRKIDVRIFLKVGDREVDLWSTRSDVNEANRPESESK